MRWGNACRRRGEGCASGSARSLRRSVRGEEPDLTPFGNLDYAAEYTGELHAALQAAGYDAELLTDPKVLRAAELGKRVEQQLSGGEVVVVHVLSHGDHTRRGGVYVIGSDARFLPETRVEQWCTRVTDTPSAPTTLFLLDLCHAGAAVAWHPPEPDEQERAWVIAATGVDQPAYAGRLTRAATTVINDITSGHADLAETVPSVSFDVLFERIRSEVRRLALDEDGHLQDPVCTPVMGAQPELPFFPNPRYRPNPATEAAARVEPTTAPFLDPALDEEHFRDRAAGHGPASGRVTRGIFTGRARQLRRLATWMDGHDDSGDRGGLMVVTGSPGMGKSALLGVAVCAAHPQLRQATEELWRAAAARPSKNSNLAAVHARQRSLTEITGSLGRQLLSSEGALYPGPDLHPHDELFPAGPRTADQLVMAIAQLSTPPVIVLDALDEAPDHQRIVAELLIPLARARRPDGEPACRLLIGTRPWPELTPLLDVARDIGEVIDLDTIPAEQRRHDVADYITTLLELLADYATTADGRGRRAFGDAVAATLVTDKTRADSADVQATGEVDVREVRWGEFLVAALYTHTVSLTQPGRFIDPAEAARLGAMVPRTLPEVLELDLAARPPSRWRRPLLTVLAHARGGGAPRTVLPAVIAAVTGEPVGPSVEQVAKELEALRFYLRTSAETDDSALYRLFHQGLADYLGNSPGDDSLAVARRVLDGLLSTVPVAQGVRRWDLAETYLLHHAIEHAAELGRVDELLEDPGFLRSRQTRPPSSRPSPTLTENRRDSAAAVYRASAGWHAPRSIEQRRSVLAVDAAAFGASALRDTLSELPGPGPLRWHPRWATGGQVSGLWARPSPATPAAWTPWRAPSSTAARSPSPPATARRCGSGTSPPTPRSASRSPATPAA